MRSRLETAAQDSGEEEWVTGVEGDSGSQSSDGTEQELEYCDQTGRGGDRNFSTIGGARGGDCESPKEGENYKRLRKQPLHILDLYFLSNLHLLFYQNLAKTNFHLT